MSTVVTPSVYTDSHAGAIPAPPLRHAHDAAAARDDSGAQKPDYAWLSRDILFSNPSGRPISDFTTLSPIMLSKTLNSEQLLGFDNLRSESISKPSENRICRTLRRWSSLARCQIAVTSTRARSTNRMKASVLLLAAPISCSCRSRDAISRENSAFACS